MRRVIDFITINQRTAISCLKLDGVKKIGNRYSKILYMLLKTFEID